MGYPILVHQSSPVCFSPCFIRSGQNEILKYLIFKVGEIPDAFWKRCQLLGNPRFLKLVVMSGFLMTFGNDAKLGQPTIF